MNDYGPDFYALLEGTHASGYQITPTDCLDDRWTLSLASTGETLREGRTLAQVLDDVDRYSTLTANLSRSPKGVTA